MIESMKHEHFYVSGICFAPEIGIYGGWVAHEGSVAGNQSTSGKCNDIGLLFSGECFPPLLSLDYSVPAGQRNAERAVAWLSGLYNKVGDRFVGQMNGLFSGLLIDRKRKRALLFNDRYGIERIYYYEKDGITFFASEAKALLQVLPELREFDDEGVAQFLTYGCTLGGRTLFRGLRFLPGGSLYTFEEGVCIQKQQYFRPEDWESQSELAERDFELEFIEKFRQILPQYLSSDSQIGISLTGGLDTRMIMACIPPWAAKLVSYTFAGLTGKTLDARLAADVAQVCGIEHHILRVGADFLSNYGHYVDRTVFVTDGCAGALGAHEIYLNAQARHLSQVRLTGNFGSEVLRSMSTFKPTGLSVELFDSHFRHLLSSLIQSISSNKVHPVTFAAFQEIPWNLFGTLAAGRSQLTFRTPYLDNEIVALAFRAPVNARQSPKSALRLIKDSNPELGKIQTDRGLVWGKRDPHHMMRRLFSEATFKLDYFHKEGLPHWLSPLDPLIGSFAKFGLLGLHKFLPYRRWFRQEVATYISDVLNDAHTRRLPYWDSRFLRTVVTDHVRGRKNYIREIHAVLTLEAVERLFMRSPSERPLQAAKHDV